MNIKRVVYFSLSLSSTLIYADLDQLKSDLTNLNSQLNTLQSQLTKITVPIQPTVPANILGVIGGRDLSSYVNTDKFEEHSTFDFPKVFFQDLSNQLQTKSLPKLSFTEIKDPQLLTSEPVILIISHERNPGMSQSQGWGYNLEHRGNIYKSKFLQKPKLIHIFLIHEDAVQNQTLGTSEEIMRQTENNFIRISNRESKHLGFPITVVGFITDITNGTILLGQIKPIRNPQKWPANFYELATDFNKEQLDRLAQALK